MKEESALADDTLFRPLLSCAKPQPLQDEDRRPYPFAAVLCLF
jgi:hypothetical protein